MKEILEKLLMKRNLTYKEMYYIMSQMMSGEIDDINIAAFLIALRAKGETVDEITASAACMQNLSTPVELNHSKLVDIVGTGGDGQSTFNISTASAFVAASAGVVIAKHGNRSASSKSGSADVLENAGININLGSKDVKRCVDTLGIGFMFAPCYHPAMRHAINVRKTLKVRTLFNLLGPLTNPAGAKRQVIGVFAKKWLMPITQVFKSLGSIHTLVVHSEDGLDEFSISQLTHVAELKEGEIHQYQIHPGDFGLYHPSLDGLRVNGPLESYQIILDIFHGKKGPARDIVLLNAAAAIYCADLCSNLKEGINIAIDAIDSKKALNCFNSLKKFTNEL